MELMQRILPFFLKRNRHPLPLSLKEERIYILPTGRGYLFTLVVLSMVFGSLNYNNNAGFLFAFLLSSMCMVSTLYTQRNLAGLTLISENHEPVFAGDRLWFDLVIKSEKETRYKITAGFQKEPEITRDIPKQEPVIFRIPLTTKTRGVHRPGKLVLSTTYPFGLLRTWVVIRPSWSFVVFPAPLEHPLVTTQSGEEGEGSGASGETGSDDFRELSTYRAGDPMNRIDWKTYARGQGLWTRVFDAELGNPVYLSWEDLTTGNHEERISQLSHLVTLSHQEGRPYGLIIPGTTIKPGECGSLAHRNQCLTALARMPISAEGAP